MWDDLGAHSYLKDPTGRAVTVEVKKALDWTENDVKLNKGIFLNDDGREMKVLESKLRNKRIFDVSRFHLD
jgi:hypothetical protein